MPHPTQLLLDESALVVIDVQEKLAPRIHGVDAMVRNIAFLLECATRLGVPAVATEQYPKGLGPTIAALADRLPPPRPDKVGFSCCAIPTFAADFRTHGRTRLVLTGIESHVCVLNTALDLLDQQFHVYLPVDALGSRSPLDHDIALRRLERAGAVLTTSETVVFEWLGGALHPRFKEISALIQKRSQS